MNVCNVVYRYAKGRSSTSAWRMHEADPTKVSFIHYDYQIASKL